MSIPEQAPQFFDQDQWQSPAAADLRRPRSRKGMPILGWAIGLTLAVTIVIWCLEGMGIEVWPRSRDSWTTIEYRCVGGNDLAYFNYTRRVSEQDARRLGDFLNDIGFFDHPLSVLLTRDDDKYVVSFFIDQRIPLTDGLVGIYEDLRLRITREVFSDQTVVLRLCDPKVKAVPGPGGFHVRRTLS